LLGNVSGPEFGSGFWAAHAVWFNGVRGDAGAAREGRWPVYTNAVLELTFQLLDLRVQELLPDG
jgi:hypothetical protein